ncbi:MAG: fibronectin type III domain-containing protein [Candidatus Eisenbacteria bacterium]|uniref:Fibronectin type III domain-containing protein n=1 Tax=Eiseniibacteriota bacterium TaxID=2212470 RepID=A0A937XEN5_UNCEI|nr:fibronectin type III domain-containing protein [Candidatus Eisenbacteria bacterium]
MHASRVTKALLAIVFASSLGLITSGCSNDEAGFTAPGTALAASGNGSYPPAMPTGLAVVKATRTGIKLAWDPNTEEDLAGYRVFMYDPDPWRSNSYVCCNETSLVGTARSSYLYGDNLTDGTYYFKVAAVDLDGNEGPRTAPIAYTYSSMDRDGREYDQADRGSGFQPPSGGAPEEWDPGREQSEPDGGGVMTR